MRCIILRSCLAALRGEVKSAGIQGSRKTPAAILGQVLSIVSMAAAGRLAAAEETAAAVANVPHCVVVLAEQADLPPLEAGVILDVAATEGQ